MDIIKQNHHEQHSLCMTRPCYRQGGKLTAVKVYTVCDESVHLIVCRVPAIKLHSELCKLCNRFGVVTRCVKVPNYESEEKFVETYHVQYARIQSARYAKQQLDERTFYGGVLHVCYAPELETCEDTKQKLIQRRKEVAARIKRKFQSNERAEDLLRCNVNNSTSEFFHKMDVTVKKADTCRQSSVHSRNKVINVHKPILPEQKPQDHSEWQPNTDFIVDCPSVKNKIIPDPIKNQDKPNTENHLGIIEGKLKLIPRPVAITKRIIFHRK